MNSISNYLDSIASFDEQRKPFYEKIEELDSRIRDIEAQMEELECELSDLEDEKEPHEEELKRINKCQRDAYLLSLSDPKSIIQEYLTKSQEKGMLGSLKLEVPGSDSPIIVSSPFKRIVVNISFPDIAHELNQYSPLYLIISPDEKTQPWQMNKIIKLMKQYQFIGNLRRIGTNEYLLPATLETLADVIFQRLSVLATFAAELDAPMAYEYNPEDID